MIGQISQCHESQISRCAFRSCLLSAYYRLLTNPSHGSQITWRICPHPRRRLASQHLLSLSASSSRSKRGRRRLGPPYYRKGGVGPRTLVVQARSRLPKVAVPCTHVRVPPRSLPRLHVWHTRSGHVGSFTTLAPRRGLRRRRSPGGSARRGGNITRIPAPSSSAPYPASDSHLEFSEISCGLRWRISRVGGPLYRAPQRQRRMSGTS